ncbi:short-chain dehydrogenase/reductase [Yokenella regensburgei ATCC 49455]|nr:short-chain dehydrogenase/reductase [Yokenella regensburgei ATCC 49455]
MGGERAGAILTVVAPAGPLAVPGHLGHIVGCAGTEAFVKALASELGPKNIRVVGVRSHAIADAVQAGSYTREVFTPKAQAMGLTVEQWVGGAAHSTMLNRLPTLAQVAEVMTFLASDNASAMTATMVNVTAGTTTS